VSQHTKAVAVEREERKGERKYRFVSLLIVSNMYFVLPTFSFGCFHVARSC
jgi:hypothetical protein